MKYPFPRKSRNVHWARWFFALVIPVIVFFAVFGKGGVIHNYAMRVHLDSVVDQTRDLERSNDNQRSMIEKIQKNPGVAKRMVSKVALVAPQGSVIYRFPKNDSNSERELRAYEEASAMGRFMLFVNKNWE